MDVVLKIMNVNLLFWDRVSVSFSLLWLDCLKKCVMV